MASVGTTIGRNFGERNTGIDQRPKNPSNLDWVTPRSARTYLYNGAYGIDAQFQKNTSVYKFRDETFTRLRDAKIKYVRFPFDAGNIGCTTALRLCRTYGLKALLLPWSEATGSPTTMTDAEFKANIDWIVNNHYENEVWGFEGLNEPNENRGNQPGGPPVTTPGWENVALHTQQLLWTYVKSKPTLASKSIVICSLNDGAAKKNNGAHYTTMKNTGIRAYGDYIGLHYYAGGYEPDNGLDVHLGYVAGFNRPVVVTETGYTNCINHTTQHKPTTEAVSSTYAVRSILQFFTRPAVAGHFRFEALDDPNPAKDEVESNFGAWGMTGNNVSNDPNTFWYPKQEVANLTGFFNQINETDMGDYTPTDVQLEITGGPATMQTEVIQKRDGTTIIALWNAARIWNPVSQTNITVAPVNATVSDPVGDRVISVTKEVQYLTHRA